MVWRIADGGGRQSSRLECARAPRTRPRSAARAHSQYYCAWITVGDDVLAFGCWLSIAAKMGDDECGVRLGVGRGVLKPVAFGLPAAGCRAAVTLEGRRHVTGPLWLRAHQPGWCLPAPRCKVSRHVTPAVLTATTAELSCAGSAASKRCGDRPTACAAPRRRRRHDGRAIAQRFS